MNKYKTEILHSRWSLKGFTTMELSIVMLMTGLISSMAYGGYSLLNKQMTTHTKITEEAFQLQQFIGLLKKDFYLSKKILSKENHISMIGSDQTIDYDFEYPDFITRTQSLLTDTFRLSYRDLSLRTFENNLVDRLSMEIEYKKQTSSLVFTKKYDSYTLIQRELNNGH